jgi:hypothetical protein
MCVCVWGGGGGGGAGGNAYCARRLTAPSSCAAPVALELAARHRSCVICHTWDGRSMYGCCQLHVACCMLHAVRLLSHVACCHRSRQFRRIRTRADALVGMAVADEAVGRTALVALHAHSALATAAAAHTMHSSCTASIAAEQCRLAATTDHGHRHREGAAGGRDGEEPGRLVRRAAASLQGTRQRRRWALAARMLYRACCALPASISLQLSRLTLFSVLRYLFVCLFACFLFVCLLVCLFVCLFGCLFATGLCRPAVDGLFAVCCRSAPCVHWCVAASPAEPLPHKRTAPVRMRRLPPKAVEYSAASESIERPLATRLRVNTRSRTSARP